MKLPFIESNPSLWAALSGIVAIALVGGCQSMGKGAALGAMDDRVIEEGSAMVEPRVGLFHPARTPSGPVDLPQRAWAPEGHYY